MSRFRDVPPLPDPRPAETAGSVRSGEASDSLDAFRAETFGSPVPHPTANEETAVSRRPSAHQAPGSGARPAPPPANRRVAAIGGVGLLALIALLVLYVAPRPGDGLVGIAAPALGSATVDSNPPGAEVVVDGEFQGTTPLRLPLPAGEHLLEVSDGTTARSISLMVEAGTLTAQYVEFAPTTVVPATGQLEVTSDPPGAQVVVDTTRLGTTPLTLETLDVGTHQISVSSGAGTVSRAVTIEAGTTSTIMVSLAGTANAAGWVGIRAPIELQILEGGRLVGTTSAEQMMLPAGVHDLELVSSEFEFRTTIRTLIAPGGTATETIEMPDGFLSINALPWAEVYVDGAYAGTTPLGNLAVPIGLHEVVWRHPELGERRRTVPVSAETPTRVGVNFSQ